jgi:hypothetical protein
MQVIRQGTASLSGVCVRVCPSSSRPVYDIKSVGFALARERDGEGRNWRVENPRCQLPQQPLYSALLCSALLYYLRVLSKKWKGSGAFAVHKIVHWSILLRGTEC